MYQAQYKPDQSINQSINRSMSIDLVQTINRSSSNNKLIKFKQSIKLNQKIYKSINKK